MNVKPLQPQGGRPTIPIDREEFEKLCAIHATLEEISGWFKVTVGTIERWCKRTYSLSFAQTLKRYSAPGKVSLRRHLYAAAQKGNLGAAIWLSKQHLGMTEKFEGKQEIDVEQNVVYRTEWRSEEG